MSTIASSDQTLERTITQTTWNLRKVSERLVAALADPCGQTDTVLVSLLEAVAKLPAVIVDLERLRLKTVPESHLARRIEQALDKSLTSSEEESE